MLVAACVAFVLSFVCIRIVLARFGQLALDRPNERSLHERPVPRSGGFAVLAGVAAALAFGALELWPVLAVAVLLAAVSFLDDLYRLPAIGRLCAHLLAGGITAWYILSPMHLVELAVIILAITWITNLYNFMDGSDGLAGGMSVIGFTTYAFAAWLAGETALALVAASVAGAASAFLLYNFHPARIFLGDVGSIPLGFLAAALGILGWRNDAWPLWFPLVVFGPFIGDATLTLVKRVIRGERVWRAHREHYYQRMIRMGLGHRATAYIEYATMAVCAGAALFGRQQPPGVQAAVFCAVTIGLVAIALWVDARWARHSRDERVTA